MPLKYDPDTGIPSYVPDLGEELEEGVTPAPTVIDSKSHLFAGDKALSKEEYEFLRDKGRAGKTTLQEALDAPIEDEVAKMARAAKLDALVATDEEIDAIEKLANEHSILHWPTLLRLINRLRKAEKK